MRSRGAAVARLGGIMVGGSAVLIALLIGAAMILALGANPLEGYKELLIGAFGGPDELAESAAKAMPLLLVGTGICVAFRARVINIGGEGPDHRRRAALHDHRTRRSRPALGSADPAGPVHGTGGGRHLGRHPWRAQGLPGGQRDPVHHHAQPRGRATVQLPAAGPADGPQADRAGHPHSPDQAAVGERRPARAHLRHSPAPRRRGGPHRRGRRLVLSCGARPPATGCGPWAPARRQPATPGCR